MTSKTIPAVLALIGATLLPACGPSAAEKAEMARLRADSIARAERIAAEEARRADSIAAAEAQKEAERIARLREKAIADSTARVAILPDFVRTDNHGGAGITLYRAKGTPTRHAQNSVYLSFTVADGRKGPLEMNVDYCGQNFIDLNNIVFTIGDEDIQINPDTSVSNKVNDNLTCSEWFVADTGLDKLLEKLATVDKAQVKFVGADGSRTITLGKRDLGRITSTATLHSLFP